MNKIKIKREITFPENGIFNEGKKEEKPALIHKSNTLISIKKERELNELLFTAVKRDNVHEIIRLLREGANVNAFQTYNNKNIVRVAVESEKIDFIKLLVDNGADLENKDSNNSNATCLIHASIECSLEMVEELVKRNANLNATDIHGNTALMGAVLKERKDVVKFLLSKLADSNIQNLYGNTALIYAVIRKNYDITKLLIDNHANKHYRNVENKTAICYALENNYNYNNQKIIDLLDE
jgi:ankyrin repeat protein